MPRLDAVRDALLDALDRPPAAGVPPADDDLFGRLVEVWFRRVTTERAGAKALGVFEEEGWTDAAALAAADPASVVASLRTREVRLADRDVVPLIRLARWFVDHDFGAAVAADWSTDGLRDAWRAIPGISAAGADTLLLVGLGRPAYPVDHGSYRIFARHGWIDTTADYDEARSGLERLAPDDPAGLLRAAEALPAIARTYCKPAAPRCERCPLRPFLPEKGPVGDE